MTAVLLVRHAVYDGLGSRLGGRLAGLRLSAEGEAQAERLGVTLAGERIDLLLSSPRERCFQTADAIASRSRVKVELCDDLDEVDFGAWAGRAFDDLARETGWRVWNEQRSRAATPAGDAMPAVQARVLRAVADAASRAPDGTAVLVSHAEPIRAALCHAMGRSLDAWATLEVAPASVHRLTVDERGVRCGDARARQEGR